MEPLEFEIQIYQDGDNPPLGFTQVREAWVAAWRRSYEEEARLRFLPPRNLKQAGDRRELPNALKMIETVRNPDMYFVEQTRGIELGGVEVTAHSPDGSNIEKRYPYLWASRRMGVDAFVATPYQKGRPTGQTNRLPYRHAARNVQFLDTWEPLRGESTAIQQFVPLRELHGHALAAVPTEIGRVLFDWVGLGEFFAHRLAAKGLTGAARAGARSALEAIGRRLRALSKACQDNARHTEPTTLLRLPDRWIQVYNTRPDSGHWERGEGQFDSIDGRLMFTLDEIDLLPETGRPARLEFWLPQLSSHHPWVVEQRERGYGSKRFRNLCVVLPELSRIQYVVRFSDQLTSADWRVLEEHPSLTLERLDSEPSVTALRDLVPASRRGEVARRGLQGRDIIADVEHTLRDENLCVSTHRAYEAGWQEDLEKALLKLPSTAVVLCPRIPPALLDAVRGRVRCQIRSSDECTKLELMTLRQVHRYRGGG